MKKMTVWIGCALLSVSTYAWSKDIWDMSIEELQQIRVHVATGTPTTLQAVPAVASVITAQDIKRMGATTLDEVLEQVPGLHVSLSSNRLNSVYSVRGIHTTQNPQVLLIIDGVMMRNRFYGSRTNTFRLPVNNIARIEVVRGPDSAVYGSDAFAGVINVTTKSVEDMDGFHAGANTGSSQHRNVWLQYGTQVGEWQVAANIEHSIGDADNRRQVTSDAASGRGASYAGVYPLQTQHNVLNTSLKLSNAAWDFAFYGWQQRHGGTGAGFAQAIDPQGYSKTDIYQFKVGYRFPERILGWDVTSGGYLFHENQRNHLVAYPAGTLMPLAPNGNIRPTANCKTAQCVLFSNGVIDNPEGFGLGKHFELTALYDGIQNHLFRVNLGGHAQKMTPKETKNFGPGTPTAAIAARPYSSTASIVDGTLTDVSNTSNAYITEQKQYNYFVSLQDQWQLTPVWALTAGLRWDHYSDFGDAFDPRFALVWDTTSKLTSKLLFGSAFRAPAFAELYVQNNTANQGNPNLKPETINTTELVFNYRPTVNWSHNLNLYHYRAKDLIDFVSQANGIKLAQNAYQQNGYGVEITSQWRINSAWRVDVAYAWQQAENQSPVYEIPNAPGRHLITSLQWQTPTGWSWHTSLNRIMDRHRAINDPRPAIADYTIVNSTLRRQLTKQVEIAGAVRNLLNADAREPSDGKIPNDYPLSGRTFMLELRYSAGK